MYAQQRFQAIYFIFSSARGSAQDLAHERNVLYHFFESYQLLKLI